MYSCATWGLTMGCISVVVPAWAVESGEVALAVDDLWQAALVAVPWEFVLPAGADVAAGVTGPAPDEADVVRPAYGWIASSVATVPPEERVEAGNMVGHLPLTAMDAAGFRFAIEGTFEGRWRCDASVFEYLPHLLDRSSPISAAAMMRLRVMRIVRFDRDVNRGVGTPIETTVGFVDEYVAHYVLDVEH